MYAHFLSVSEIQESMFDCCKQIFKLVMNDQSIVLFDLDTCVDLCPYISSHLLFCQKLYKHQSLKEEELKKPCFENQFNQEKVEQKCIQLYDSKAKGLFIKDISKISWHHFSKIELYRSKSMKNGSQMKSFQSNLKILVGGHICSFLLMRQVTWLHASCV